MTHAYAELVRPDSITRSGIIQPFNVVSQSPVAYARHEIDPFLAAIRSSGATMPGGIQIDGASSVRMTFEGPLGIVSPEVIRTLGAEDAPKMSPWLYAGAALLLGLAGGYFMGKVL